MNLKNYLNLVNSWRMFFCVLIRILSYKACANKKFIFLIMISLWGHAKFHFSLTKILCWQKFIYQPIHIFLNIPSNQGVVPGDGRERRQTDIGEGVSTGSQETGSKCYPERGQGHVQGDRRKWWVMAVNHDSEFLWRKSRTCSIRSTKMVRLYDILMKRIPRICPL